MKIIPTTSQVQFIDTSLPVPLAISVYVSVEWKIFDDSGKQLVVGDDFLAPDGIASPQVVFTIASPAEEPTDENPPPAPKPYKITVHVRLDAQGIPHEFNLQDIPVLVPVISVPLILALFRHDQFYRPELWGNAILIVTPPGSDQPKDVGTVLASIQPVRAIASRFAGLAWFALFLAELDKLASLLRTPPPKQPAIKVVPVASDSTLNDLKDIRLFSHKDNWGRVKKFYADQTSSLIVIGAPNRRVELFNKTDRQTGKGQLNLTLDKQMFVAIPSLHSPSPSATPQSAVAIAEAPPDSFGNTIKSLKLGTVQGLAPGLRFLRPSDDRRPAPRRRTRPA